MSNNKMKKIKELISQNDWDTLILKCSVDEVYDSLNFFDAMHLVEKLFYDYI